MKIVLGIPDGRLPIWELGVPLMINQLTWEKIPWENETWVDSGGYQIMMRRMDVNLETVYKKYTYLNAKVFMSLDRPVPPCSPVPRENFQNFEFLYHKLEDREIVPVIHAYNRESLMESIDFYKSYGVKKIAYGGIVPPTMGQRGSRDLVRKIYKVIRKHLSSTWIHVLGAGSPYMRTIFYDANSVDTSTYRIKAIHGMVIIPGKGERYVGERKIVWRVKRASQEELDSLLSFLEKTSFPFRVDLSHWKQRSLINAWVLIKSSYSSKRQEVEPEMNLSEMEDEIGEQCDKLSNSLLSA
ncbi:hypothetical protein IC006_0018 [Sulfuracidifex tepidarius]|uniref:Queuine tRNA-ribosyltransferase n=1 Tax=Sulfuracidifex tepidarius TaxID=1294262 RepID=A0A510DRF0_9CREN|nr:hypothetical protein [Sulfuracidifex tepidarius]BBG22734.1 hypothetical protein IC006_0018 [Sulfuracidifex tepidarius]